MNRLLFITPYPCLSKGKQKLAAILPVLKTLRTRGTEEAKQTAQDAPLVRRASVAYTYGIKLQALKRKSFMSSR
jgi:hypothetical protein